MSAQPSIARPSETPTLAHHAYVDSPFRCRGCGKRKVVEIHYDHEQRPLERHVCLNCSPYSTRADDCDGFDPLAGIDLTPVPFIDEMDAADGAA